MKKILYRMTGIILVVLFVITASAKHTEQAEAKENQDIVVVIDAGHGSIDGGAYQNGVQESLVNWQIALAMKAELQTYGGVKVYLTRGSSEWNSNTGRGRLGLAVNADFAISLHNNSSGTAAVNGIEVYGTVNPSYSAITSAIGNAICSNVSSLGITNRGYKTRLSGSNANRDFYTFIDEGVRAGIPAMIVEYCFLSNPSDAAFISNADNQKKAGAATATAVAKYFGLEKLGVANGQSITLTRTYSAAFMSTIQGDYKSDNEAVAKVGANGIITAVGAGTANITCTGIDGTVEKVTITVPEVKMVAVAAGISPTFYDPNENINNADIIVKGIYSDGSVTQLKNYTIGETAYSSNGIYDIPITSNGITGYLRVYKTGSLGSFTGGAAYGAGSNTDILTFPQVYQGINTGINTVTTPKYSTYVGVAPELFGIPNTPDAEASAPVNPPAPKPTEPSPKPTEPAPKPTEPPTDSPTETQKEEPTAELTDVPTETTAEEMTESPSDVTSGTPAEATTETLTESRDDGKNPAKTYQKWLIIGLAAISVLVAGTVVVVVISMRKQK